VTSGFKHSISNRPRPSTFQDVDWPNNTTITGLHSHERSWSCCLGWYFSMNMHNYVEHEQILLINLYRSFRRKMFWRSNFWRYFPSRDHAVKIAAGTIMTQGVADASESITLCLLDNQVFKHCSRYWPKVLHKQISHKCPLCLNKKKTGWCARAKIQQNWHTMIHIIS
jgi:hypothetical protein